MWGIESPNYKMGIYFTLTRMASVGQKMRTKIVLAKSKTFGLFACLLLFCTAIFNMWLLHHGPVYLLEIWTSCLHFSQQEERNVKAVGTPTFKDRLDFTYTNSYILKSWPFLFQGNLKYAVLILRSHVPS